MLPKTYPSSPFIATKTHSAPKLNKNVHYLNCDEVVKKYELPDNTMCSYADHITDNYPLSHFDFLHLRKLDDGTTIKVCCLVYSALMRKLYGENWVSHWVAGSLKQKKRYNYPDYVRPAPTSHIKGEKRHEN